MSDFKNELTTITMRAGESVVCPFCGQARVLTRNIKVAATSEGIEFVGALECGCAEARGYQNKKKSKDNVPQLLDSFIAFCNLEENSEAANLANASTGCIQDACFAIIDGKAEKITLNIKEVKVKLSLNKDKQLEMKLESKKGFVATT